MRLSANVKYIFLILLFAYPYPQNWGIRSGVDLFSANPSVSVASTDLLHNIGVSSNWKQTKKLLRRGYGKEKKQVFSDSTLPGNRYKISINQDGIYQLSYSTLQSAGLDVDNLDPTTFQMINQGVKIAIFVENNDGNEHSFSPTEYILFYGQKFYGDYLATIYEGENAQWLYYNRHYSDGTYGYWKPSMNAIMLEKYTDTNVYWLSYGDGPGLRMDIVDGTPAGAASIDYYRETVHEEQSRYWKTTTFTGEDTWFWDYMYVSPSITEATNDYEIDLSSVLTGSYTATVRGEMVAASFNALDGPDHETHVYLNDPGRTEAISSSTWEGRSRYHFEVQVPQEKLVEGLNQLGITMLKTEAMLIDQMYFDWFEIEYWRSLQATNDQLDFQNDVEGAYLYEMGGFSDADITILDISEPFTPTMVISNTHEADIVQFQYQGIAGSEFYAGSIVDILAGGVEFYEPPDLTNPADYILISHANFIPTLQPLINLRESQGLTTLVVDVDDLYNQFNYGIFNPIAIKNFLRYTFENWDYSPTYVILVGDGHWNFKAYSTYNSPPIYMPPNLAWVDPWQGEVDSTNSLAAVVGDDPLPDVQIARMPVNTPGELNAIITKIIQYEQAGPQDWQRNVVFVADNVPDEAGDFIADSESLISGYMPLGYSVQRIYENDYGCPSPDPDQKYCPWVNNAIIDSLNITGTLLLNYNGHASVNRWASEQIFVNSNIPSLSNSGKYPIIFSMSCLDGYWYHPGSITSGPFNSLIEEMLRADNKGAVAAFSPTGLGVSTGHDALGRGFYASLFKDGVWELGTAARSALNEVYSTGTNLDLISTFTFFGDPAMKISSPYEFGFGPDTVDASGSPGWASTVDFVITNTAVVSDTYMVNVTDSQWPTIYQSEIGPISPGASGLVRISVNIPLNEPLGSSGMTAIEVISHGDRTKFYNAIITTTVIDYRIAMPILNK